MLEIERAIEDLSSAGRFILEELVDNGFAVLHDGWFRLSFLDVWSFEAATRDALGLSTLYGMQLEVVVRGVLGQVGTSFELRLESELGRHTEQALEGGLIRWADDVFLLPKGVGIAIGAIKSRGPRPNAEEQYLLLSEIRNLEGVVLPDAFEDGVEVLKGWGLEVKEEQGGVRLDFGQGKGAQNNDVDLTGFGSKISKGNASGIGVRQMRSSYGLPNGKRIFIASGARPSAFGMMEQRKKILTRRDLAAALHADPAMGLDPNVIGLDGFSERVAQLGVYVADVQIFVKGSGTQWQPEVVIGAETVMPLRMLIHCEEDFMELELAVAKGSKAKDGLVEFRGLFIPLIQGIELVGLLRNRFIDGSEEIPRGTLIPIVREEEGDADAAWQTTLGRLSLLRPPNLRPQFCLREHQEQGVAWLQELAWNRGARGALLADDMGLGKTLQVWSFLDAWQASSEVKGPMLVVAPVSLLENWLAEYHRFFEGGFNVGILRSNQIDRFEWEKLGEGDVVLVNYEGMVRAAVPMAQIDWSVVAMDETQKIKNPATLVSHVSKSLKAQFRIAMTGTPVENSLLDFWNVMDFLSPGLLGTKLEFKKEYRVDGNTQEKLLAAGRLREKVGWHMLRRLKEDVAKDLPPKTEHPSNWDPSLGMHSWSSEMTTEQHQVYAGIQKHFDEVTRLGVERYVTSLLRALEGWRLAVDHPLLVEKLEGVLSDQPVNELIAQSAKLTHSVGIIDDIQAKGEKVLVFTNFKMTQRMLRRVFQERYGIRVPIINGDTPAHASTRAKESRQQVVERFNALSGFAILVLSPIAAGFGLNIQGANHVIHFTRHWNPAKEAQATDRAYRIGQTLPVSVYYPMSLSTRLTTFDARLHELLLSKKALADESLIPSEEVKLADFNT